MWPLVCESLWEICGDPSVATIFPTRIRYASSARSLPSRAAGHDAMDTVCRATQTVESNPGDSCQSAQTKAMTILRAASDGWASRSKQGPSSIDGQLPISSVGCLELAPVNGNQCL